MMLLILLYLILEVVGLTLLEANIVDVVLVLIIVNVVVVDVVVVVVSLLWRIGLVLVVVACSAVDPEGCGWGVPRYFCAPPYVQRPFVWGPLVRGPLV